jgi:CRP-like cAMP-binding protein/rhodanese-related sulfurtransferase
MPDLVEKILLKSFVPPSALNAENFQELAGKTFVEDVSAGKAIFKEGDTDRQSVYLLDGQAEISSSAGETKIVLAGSDIAKHPLVNQQPRKHTAMAKVDSKVIRIDSDLLDILLTWDQLSGIEVDEIQVDEGDDGEDDDSDGDWMTRILQSKAFLQIPPANIQALFMRVEEIPMKAGDAVIKQGEDGDYYYIIKHGKCKVTRNSKTGSELTLATLGDGDAFGEEALLSEAKRNANIIMTTDGSIMRLSKEEPMLSWVTNEEADALVKDKGAVWLDVRLDSEFKNANIEGSINIPLFMLRLKAQSLDSQKEYILYCNSGRQSSACAYLLSERGLLVHCLKGGLVERSSG